MSFLTNRYIKNPKLFFPKSVINSNRVGSWLQMFVVWNFVKKYKAFFLIIGLETVMIIAVAYYQVVNVKKNIVCCNLLNNLLGDGYRRCFVF